jgi:hypothetical protein
MSFAGRMHLHLGFLKYILTGARLSWRNALHIIASYSAHACHRPPYLAWCSQHRFCSIYIVCTYRTFFFSQVFYGRYLKKLSNKTQEALGDMTKVRSLSLLLGINY